MQGRIYETLCSINMNMHLFALMRSHWSKTRTHHDDCCLNLDVSFEKCCEIIQHTPPKKLTCPLKKSWDWKTRPAFPFWNGPRVILQSQSQPAMTSIPSEPEPRHVPLVRTIPRAASAWQWISGWIIACKVVIVPWIGGLFSCWLDGWDLGKNSLLGRPRAPYPLRKMFFVRIVLKN